MAADNYHPPEGWKGWSWRPDLTEPNLNFYTRPGSFMDKFFTLAFSVNRFDSECEEWLRYGRNYYSIIKNTKDTKED